MVPKLNYSVLFLAIAVVLIPAAFDETKPSPGGLSSLWSMSSSTCPCDEDNLPTPADITASVNLEFNTPTITVPLLGGEIGLSFRFMGEYKGQEGDCSNDCEDKTEGNLSIEAKVKAMDEISVMGSYEGSKTTTKCKECDDDTCLEVCKGEVCVEEESQFSLGGGLTWKKGIRQQLGKGKVSAVAKCAVEATIRVMLNGGKKEKKAGSSPGDCEACKDCTERNGGFGVSITPTAVCSARVRLGRRKLDIGCQKCGQLTVGGGVDVKFAEGDCPNDNETCVAVNANTNGNLVLQKRAKIAFWQFDVGCGFDWNGKWVRDSCANDTDSWNINPRCNVRITTNPK